MSLITPAAAPKQWRLGIIVSRSFDNPDVLPDFLAEFIPVISHVHTNGAPPGGKLVEDFCRENKLSYTVWSTTANAFHANCQVIENSDSVYIVSDGKSKSAKQAEERCVAKKIKCKVLFYDPVTDWKKKVEDAREILATAPDDILVEIVEGLRKVLK